MIDLDEANQRILIALGGPQALASMTSARKDFMPLHETFMARIGPNLDLVLDAGQQSNLARFINHACEPNLVAECWTVEGLPRLGTY